MASFDKGPGLRTPFGRNVFLRSTRDVKTESRTLAASTVPAETIDGATAQKILQPGTVLAKITSGADSGKVGPFQGGGGVNEVQRITVDATGGTYTISFDGETTAAIAATATAAAVQAALEATDVFAPGDVVVTGGPGSAGGTTPYTFTFGGQYAYTNVAAFTTTTSLTGGAGTAAVTTITQGEAPGVGGPSDGRQDPANIVGLCNTFLPWQLMDRDVEVAVVYECTAVQAWCIELNAAGARVALTDAVAAAMQNKKGLSILFK